MRRLGEGMRERGMGYILDDVNGLENLGLALADELVTARTRGRARTTPSPSALRA